MFNGLASCALFIGVFYGCVSLAVSGEQLVMPEELALLAAANNCEQPADFYDNKPGPINPPFLYGVAKGNIEDSAVFWCIRNKNDDKKYVLMFMVRGKFDPELAGEMEWINPPLGLSLMQPNSSIPPLKEFKPLNKDDLIHMPTSREFADRYLVSSYDGVSEIFVLKNGKWMVLQRH